jgi:WD40 repeat protein
MIIIIITITIITIITIIITIIISSSSHPLPCSPHRCQHLLFPSSVSNRNMVCNAHSQPSRLHTNNNQIWDAVKCERVRSMPGHTGRVGALAWNSHTLSSGSRDRKILQRDTRVAEAFQSALLSHKQEVCGLEWSPDEQHLASVRTHHIHACTLSSFSSSAVAPDSRHEKFHTPPDLALSAALCNRLHPTISALQS